MSGTPFTAGPARQWLAPPALGPRSCFAKRAGRMRGYPCARGATHPARTDLVLRAPGTALPPLRSVAVPSPPVLRRLDSFVPPWVAVNPGGDDSPKRIQRVPLGAASATAFPRCLGGLCPRLFSHVFASLESCGPDRTIGVHRIPWDSRRRPRLSAPSRTGLCVSTCATFAALVAVDECSSLARFSPLLEVC